MYREIKIGAKNVPMKATGATPIRYRLVFKEDVLTEFSSVGDNYAVAIDTLSKLAFIMAMSADDSVDMSKINIDSFVNWLDGFEPFDITNASDEIVDLYMGNTVGQSEVKKKARGAVKEN
jgi:hypothetical protein